MIINDINRLLGSNVARLRQSRHDGMSQEALAAALSLVLGHQIIGSTISRMEKGHRPCTAEDLVALARVFGVRPAVLLTDLDTSDAFWEMEKRLARSLVASKQKEIGENKRQLTELINQQMILERDHPDADERYRAHDE